MKKTFTIILSILLLASCINNDYKETQKLISEADNFDIKTLSKITSKISDSKYSKDEALEIRNLYVQYLNDMGSLISDSINTLIFSTDIDNYKIEEITERKRLELQKYGIVLYNIEGELSYYILPYYVYVVKQLLFVFPAFYYFFYTSLIQFIKDIVKKQQWGCSLYHLTQENILC